MQNPSYIAKSVFSSPMVKLQLINAMFGFIDLAVQSRALLHNVYCVYDTHVSVHIYNLMVLQLVKL